MLYLYKYKMFIQVKMFFFQLLLPARRRLCLRRAKSKAPALRKKKNEYFKIGWKEENC